MQSATRSAQHMQREGRRFLRPGVKPKPRRMRGLRTSRAPSPICMLRARHALKGARGSGRRQAYSTNDKSSLPRCTRHWQATSRHRRRTTRATPITNAWWPLTPSATAELPFSPDPLHEEPCGRAPQHHLKGAENNALQPGTETAAMHWVSMSLLWVLFLLERICNAMFNLAPCICLN